MTYPHLRTLCMDMSTSMLSFDSCECTLVCERSVLQEYAPGQLRFIYSPVSVRVGSARCAKLVFTHISLSTVKLLMEMWTAL
jgi:hypothetical protein